MKLEVEIQGRLRTIELEPEASPGQYRVILDGEAVEVEARLLRPGVLSLVVAGRSYRAVREDDAPAGNGGEVAVLVAGRRFPYRVEDSRSLKARRAHSGGHDGPKMIKASMPGRVVRVLASRGDECGGSPGRGGHRSDEDAERAEVSEGGHGRRDSGRSRRYCFGGRCAGGD